MNDIFTNPLFSGDYMPHGMCYAWEPSIMWLSIASDLLIASSYFSIPIAILMFVKKRQVSNYRHIYILFALFIFFCGVTHLFSILTIFKGYYGIQSILKAITAVISFATAVAVFKYLPLAFKLPFPSELAAEQKSKAENEIFKQMSLNSPIGLILVNNTFTIQHMNPKACTLFGYDETNIIGVSINRLVPENSLSVHTSLMEKYMADPKDAYRMNSGRNIEGVTSSGAKIAIEIHLSSGHYHNEKLIFVSIIDRGEKIKTDELLRKSLMKLDRIIEATNVGLWEWNIITNEVWQSKKHLELMGYDESIEPSFQAWENHIHSDDKDRVINAVNDSIKNKTDYFVEYLGLTVKGDYEWFRSKGKLTFDASGKPILLSGTIQSIHNDVVQKTELLDKTDYLKKVINRSINGLYLYDFDNFINTYVNEEYTHITGYTLDDLLDIAKSDKFLELFHSDDLDSVLEHMSDVQNSKEGEVFSLQYRFKNKNGGWVWCLSRDSVFSFHEDGRPKEMLGTFIDITTIIESEGVQKKLMTDFQNTFEMAAVGVAHVSLDGTWIKVNNKVCDILGYNREQLLSLTFQDITYPEDLDLDLENVSALISGKIDEYDMEKRYIKSNGEIIWANLTVSIVRTDDGSPDYFISVIEDISHRKAIEVNQVRLNDELKYTNDQLTRFAYSASHDMQEPLRKITSFSTSLLSRLGEKELDEKSRFELERISSASRRMKNMIQRLLDLSRSAHVKLNLQEVSTEELFQDAIDQLSVLCQETQAVINVNGSDRLVCDRSVISNVIENIIRNSIKYKSDSRAPVIDINVLDTNAYSEITFKDNGIGFDNQFNKEIFEPFKRLVSNTEIDGTGMGLAICTQLITLHGGTINASGKEGVGSTFVIKLPKLKDAHV